MCCQVQWLLCSALLLSAFQGTEGNLSMAVHKFTRTSTRPGLCYELYTLLLFLVAPHPTAEPALLLSLRPYCAGHSQPEQGGFYLCPMPASACSACSGVWNRGSLHWSWLSPSQCPQPCGHQRVGY